MPTPQTIKLSDSVIDKSKTLNQNLSQRPEVLPEFLIPYVNLERRALGRRGLLRVIMEDRGAILPRSHTRSDAIRVGLFCQDLLEEVKARWSSGSKAYPASSIKSCLYFEMVPLGMVGKIQLTATEDSTRKCYRPRSKWYLIVEGYVNTFFPRE